MRCEDWQHFLPVTVNMQRLKPATQRLASPPQDGCGPSMLHQQSHMAAADNMLFLRRLLRPPSSGFWLTAADRAGAAAGRLASGDSSRSATTDASVS